MTDMQHEDGIDCTGQCADTETLPLPDNVISADPAPVPIIPHIHDYEDVCTSACPASPYHADHPDVVAIPAAYIHELGRKIDALTEQQRSIAGMLAGLMEQVEPTLNQISSNPLFRSMFGGK